MPASALSGSKGLVEASSSGKWRASPIRLRCAVPVATWRARQQGGAPRNCRVQAKARARSRSSLAARPATGPTPARQQSAAAGNGSSSGGHGSTHKLADAVASGLRACAAVLAAAVVALCGCTPDAAYALTRPSYDDLSRLHYGRSRKPGSALPDAREAETIAELDKVLIGRC